MCVDSTLQPDLRWLSEKERIRLKEKAEKEGRRCRSIFQVVSQDHQWVHLFFKCTVLLLCLSPLLHTEHVTSDNLVTKGMGEAHQAILERQLGALPSF